MTLLASLHDVSPANARATRELWSTCARFGVVPALLVVPDWHGGAPIESDPAFVAWLRARVADGAEILLHGERHDEVGLPRSALDHVRAFGRTAREGEFLTLDEGAARTKIERGLARLCALGLDPIGFVPPAWLAREATHRAVAAAGLRVSEDDRSIRLHPGGVRIASPTWRWSTRTRTRALVSRLAADARSLAQRQSPIVRVALHPGDLDDPLTVRSVSYTFARLLATHPAGRYADLEAERAAPR